MAVTINASTTTGLVQSADTSGIIELQNNGTTKLTVNSSGATIPTAIVTTLSDGTNSTSATNCIQGSARAWCNWTGSSGAIRGSYNVSSVTRNSTGNYTINFTNAMANANYSITGSANRNGSPSDSSGFAYYTQATGSCGVTSAGPVGGAFVDATTVSCAIFSS